MKSNLDVWAVQSNPNDLSAALSQIKDGMNIIYSNCTCNLVLGNQTIKTRQFDSILYNEESDILIMLMRDGLVTKEDVIKYLEANNKEYGEVTFAPSIEEYNNDNNIPDIWFAREKAVLCDALQDAFNKGIDMCEFYPLVTGNLDIGYITNTKDNKINLDGRLFRGVLKLDDRLVLIINQKENIDKNGNDRNMDTKEIINTIEECGFNFDVVMTNEINLESFNIKKQSK